MRAASAIRIERNVDRAASAIFAIAAAFAAYAWFAARTAQPVLGAATIAVGAFACLASLGLLRAVQPGRPKVPVPIFDLRKIEPVEPELLLTELYQEPAAADEPLVLDDILSRLEPDSRVVRLFDPAAMPTPGQLNARIERHLAGGDEPVESPDGLQALHDALANLRQSLR